MGPYIFSSFKHDLPGYTISDGPDMLQKVKYKSKDVASLKKRKPIEK